MGPYSEMLKRAAVTTRLQPHQENAVRRALLGNLILAHSTGSGKTLSAIAAADALGKPVTVLTPASLVDNFKKEIAKHTKGGPAYNVVSLPYAVRHHLSIPRGGTLILDEAHALRNRDTRGSRYVKGQIARAGRTLALTGTPIYNRPGDLSSLVNLVAGEQVLPRRPEDFERIYVGSELNRRSWLDRDPGIRPSVRYVIRNPEELRDILRRYVDVFGADVDKPQREDSYIRTGMDGRQHAVYRLLMRRLPASLARSIRENMPPSKADARHLNTFLGGIRQVSNTAEAFDVEAGPGEKIRKAVSLLQGALKKDPSTRALVYSNYLESGVDSYARELDRLGVPYGKYTGRQSRDEKRRLVEAYNRGKVPVMLVSGAGSEGLDLKGTRLIQLLEPHWNDSRLEQVVGRGIRYGSHRDLPPEKRKVLVQHFLAGLPETWRTSADDYLATRAAEKTTLTDSLRGLVEDTRE